MSDDLDPIRAGLRRRAQAVAESLLPHGRRSGDEWECGSIRGERGKSLKLRLSGDKAGVWSDFAAGDTGDLLTLIQRVQECEFPAALDWARDFLGMPRSDPPRGRKKARSARRASDAAPGGARFSPTSGSQTAVDATAPNVALGMPASSLVEPIGGESIDQQRMREDAAGIWRKTIPIAGTHAAAYLARRGLALPNGDALRFAPTLQHTGSKRVLPAMVARVAENDGTFRAVHRTWLHPEEPIKAPIDSNKMLMGTPGTGGVWLTGPADVLLVAEGIETALAGLTAMPDAAAVSAISAPGMRALELPAWAQRVTILVDDDDAGEAAARVAAERWSAEGHAVSLAWAKRGTGGGYDFADLLRDDGADAVRAALAAAESFRTDARARTEAALEEAVRDILNEDHKTKGTYGPCEARYPPETEATAEEASAKMQALLNAHVANAVRYATVRDRRHGVRRAALAAALAERPDLAGARFLPKADPRAVELRALQARHARALRDRYRDTLVDHGWLIHEGRRVKPTATRPAPLVIRAPAGLGKTHGMLEAIRDAFAAVPGDVPVLVAVLVPTHALAEELRAKAEAMGLVAVVMAGRGQKAADGTPLCQRADLAEAMSGTGLSVRRNLCGKPGIDMCPFRTTCGYYRQADALPHRGIIITTHNALASGELPAGVPAPSFEVVDEDAAGQAIESAAPDISIDRMENRGLWSGAFVGRTPAERMEKEESAHRTMKALADLLRLTLQQRQDARLQNIPDPPLDWRGFLQDRGVTLETVVALQDAADSAARQHAAIQGEDVRPSMLDGDIDNAIQNMGDRTMARVAAVLSALRRDWEGALPCLHSLAAETRHSDPPDDVCCIRSRRPFKIEDRAVLVLDASADGERMPYLWGADAQMERIEARRYAHVVQITSPSFAMSAVAAGKGDLKTPVTDQRRAMLRALILELAKQHGAENVGVITYPRLRDDLAQMLADVPGVEIRTFGSLRGLNVFENKRAIIVAGRQEPSAEAMEAAACALVSGTAKALNLTGRYEDKMLGIRMRDGTGVGVKVQMHPEPIVQAYLTAARDGELEQAIDRVRPVRAKPYLPVVYVWEDVPLDVTVDEVVPLPDLLAQLAAQNHPAGQGAVAITMEWLAAAIPILSQTPDGTPLSRRSMEGRMKDMRSAIVAKEVQFRRRGVYAQHPVRSIDSIRDRAHTTQVVGIKPPGQRALQLAVLGDHGGLSETEIEMRGAAALGLPAGGAVMLSVIAQQVMAGMESGKMLGMDKAAAEDVAGDIEVLACARLHEVVTRRPGAEDGEQWLADYSAAVAALSPRDRAVWCDAMAEGAKDQAPEALDLFASLGMDALDGLEAAAEAAPDQTCREICAARPVQSESVRVGARGVATCMALAGQRVPLARKQEIYEQFRTHPFVARMSSGGWHSASVGRVTAGITAMRTVTLTPQQEEFVSHFTSVPGCIGNGAASARAAGYSEANAREIARQLLDKPHVRAAVDEALRRQISGPAAAKSAALLERVVDDESAPLKLRVEAAKTILDRAGIVAVPRTPVLDITPPADLDLRTPEEQQAWIAHQKALLADVNGLLARLGHKGDALPMPSQATTPRSGRLVAERRVVAVAERLVEVEARPVVIEAAPVAVG